VARPYQCMATDLILVNSAKKVSTFLTTMSGLPTVEFNTPEFHPVLIHIALSLIVAGTSLRAFNGPCFVHCALLMTHSR
jgi:hypothetical protein